MSRIKKKPRVPEIEIEPYAYFVSCKEQIAAWLRNGFTMKSVWRAYKRADPPFPGSYSSLREYCLKHGLVVKDPMVHSSEPAAESLAKPSPELSKRASSTSVDIEKYRNKFDFRPVHERRRRD